MSIKEEISKNILYYRKKAKLSQKQIADRLGINHTAVSNWEIGHNSIDIEMLSKLAEIYGVTLSKMFGEDNTDKSIIARYSKDALEVADAYEELPTIPEKNVIRRSLGLDEIKKGTPAAKNDVKGEAV